MLAEQPLGWEAFRMMACNALTDVLASPITDLEPDAHLIEDIGLDSFGLLAFTGELEMRLGVGLPASMAEPTAANLFRLVTLALGNGPTTGPLTEGGGC